MVQDDKPNLEQNQETPEEVVEDIVEGKQELVEAPEKTKSAHKLKIHKKKKQRNS